MIAILEKTEHNIDFHQIVDFLKASHIRYALTICPTVYVSHIRQFWSTARIETTNQETKILATVDGKSRTISKSSLMRHLKLSDEEGISSLPDAKLFENLSLMGYNILPNQRFTFQKGKFSHQWKFLIHTIMQCLSPKSTGFNEFSSNIATAVVCLATNMVYNFSKMIFDGMMRNINNEPASLLRDDRQGEAFLTVSSLDAGQDMKNINKTSALPHESSPRVTSFDADEGTMQQKLQELMELCTSLQRQQSQMAAKIKDQDFEISGLKARVKFLEDKDRGRAEPTQEDAPIKKEIMEIGEEVGAEKSTELGSNDTEEMVNILSSIEATNILTSKVAAASVSPAAGVSAAGVLGAQHMRSPIIGAKDKGKQKMVESEVPKKRKLQEQIDAQVAKEMEEEFARENQRMSEQLARDSEIAKLHAEEELKMMIEGLDRSNKLVKYQDHHTKILKYQAQQSKPLSKKEQREFYMSKQLEDFVPMSSKEEGERVKRQGLKIEQRSSKRMKTSEDVSEEDLKGMMQLMPLEEVGFTSAVDFGEGNFKYQTGYKRQGEGVIGDIHAGRKGLSIKEGTCHCDDNTNVVNAPREPFVVKKDHCVKSSQNPPHVDECCCECGDALDGIFCQQCTFKSCGKEARKKRIEEEQAANAQYWKIPACCDDDDDYNSAITPVLSTKEPDNSLSMGDEHLDTIPATKSDEVIKSSVEDLVPIPSESEGIPDTMCDVHLVNNPTPLEAKDHFEIVINSNDDIPSSDDDSLYNENIDDDDSLYNENIEYVEASPHDSELVCLEVAEIVIPEDEEIEDDNMRKKLLNVLEDDYSPLLAYVVWIFLAYLVYPIIPPYLHSFGNEDTIFDPGITINHFCSFNPGLSHRCGTFKKFNTHRSHLNESPMEMLFSTCSPMDQ
nr:hypothetical protein [Tanacetum cinerariifolium]